MKRVIYFLENMGGAFLQMRAIFFVPLLLLLPWCKFYLPLLVIFLLSAVPRMWYLSLFLLLFILSATIFLLPFGVMVHLGKKLRRKEDISRREIFCALLFFTMPLWDYAMWYCLGMKVNCSVREYVLLHGFAPLMDMRCFLGWIKELLFHPRCDFSLLS